MQIAPSNILTAIIRHYLFLDSNGLGAKNLRLFSDGNTGIVFNSGYGLSLDVDNKLPNSFLYGQITRFKDLLLSHNTSLIIVVFQPAGIKNLLGIPAHELRDKIVSAECIFGEQTSQIEETLAESTTIREKSNILNLFFQAIFLKNPGNREQVVSTSIHLILKNRGVVSNNQLVKITGYTERHLERLFLDAIGISPKRFSGIIKLHHFLQQLRKKPEYTTLTEIAYNAGYSDQSHLIREFKKHTGMTPGLYMNNARKLAVNFISLSGSY